MPQRTPSLTLSIPLFTWRWASVTAPLWAFLVSVAANVFPLVRRQPRTGLLWSWRPEGEACGTILDSHRSTSPRFTRQHLFRRNPVGGAQEVPSAGTSLLTGEAGRTPRTVQEGQSNDQFDDAVKRYSEKFAMPAGEIMERLREAGKLTDLELDEEIERTYVLPWHHEGRRARHGAAMMGPDYVQWHDSPEKRSPTSSSWGNSSHKLPVLMMLSLNLPILRPKVGRWP